MFQQDDYFFLVKVMAVMVILAGAIVTLGWIFEIFHIYGYKSIMPQWIGMKFSVALSFILSGLVLLLVANAHQACSAPSGNLLLAASMGILLLMALMLGTSLMGFETDFEHLLVGNAADSIKTSASGMLSIGSMGAFIVISLSGILAMMNPPKAFQLLLAGAVESTFGGIAFVGALLNIPVLCFEIDGVCTGMVVPSAVLFCVLGMGFLILGTIRGNATA